MQVFKCEKLPQGIDEMDAVAVKAGLVDSMEELELAFYLAEKSFRDKTNIAKKFKYEFLLWLCGTRDIRSAQKKSGPGKGCLVILFSGEEPPGCIKANLKKKAEPLRLERISLSRI